MKTNFLLGFMIAYAFITSQFVLINDSFLLGWDYAIIVLPSLLLGYLFYSLVTSKPDETVIISSADYHARRESARRFN